MLDILIGLLHMRLRSAEVCGRQLENARMPFDAQTGLRIFCAELCDVDVVLSVFN